MKKGLALRKHSRVEADFGRRGKPAVLLCSLLLGGLYANKQDTLGPWDVGEKGVKTPSAWREPRRVNRLTLGVYNEAPTKAGEDIANPSIKLQSEY